MALGSRRSTSWKNNLPKMISTPCAPCVVFSIRKIAAIRTKSSPVRNVAPILRRESKLRRDTPVPAFQRLKGARDDGHFPRVRTVWQLDEGSIAPRLITAYPVQPL